MENFSNDTVELCRVAKFISDRMELKFVYVLQVLFGLTAILPNALNLTLLFRVKAFHANLRLILANLSCNLFVLSLSISLKAVHRLWHDPCTFPAPITTCILLDFPVIIPLHNSLLSLILLSLERLYATIKYETYDYAGSVPYLAMILLTIGWSITLSLNLPNYFSSNEGTALWVPQCDTPLAAKPQVLGTAMLMLFCFEILAAIITVYIFVYNRYLMKHIAINRALYGLSARFQVNQNVQVNKALLPGMVLHVACHLPTYVFISLFVLYQDGIPIDTKAWLLHLTLLSRQAYATMDPIVLIMLNENLKLGLRKIKLGRAVLVVFGKGNDTKVTPRAPNALAMEEMNAHFAFLKNSWAVPKLDQAGDGRNVIQVNPPAVH